MMAPVSAMAMPAAGLAPATAPQTTVDGAKLDRVAVIVRTGPVVRRGFVRRPFVRAPIVRGTVVVRRPVVRRGFVGRPGIGVRVGPRGGVGVRIR